jgi:ferredoxin
MPVDCPPDKLQAALSLYGLNLRGSFAPTPSDGLPPLPNGKPASSVWMVGVIGSDFWPHFKASTFYRDGLPDPLDRWSRALGEELAARFCGVALFPFDGPPYRPFQRWADRSEPTQPSRMLLRIHPDHGLWHAYRFALALPLAPANASTPPYPAPDLCASCSGQPCLRACPVGAYTGETFLLDACASHLHSGRGEECMQRGCLARRACPVAPALRYTPEHAAFHMQAFAARH